MPNSIPRAKVIVKDESGRERIRCYDVRIASQQYSNIAGLLSGFAFTVVILVAQENITSLTDIDILRRNFSAICFFVVFFGSILSSAVFAVISAEEALTPRANFMVLFAGSSFSLVIGILFWSIGSILKAFLVDEVSTFIDQCLPFFLGIHPLYIASSILDNIYIYQRRTPTRSEYFIALIPSLIPILLSTILYWNGIKINLEIHTQIFHPIIWAFLIMIILGNVMSVFFSTAEDDFELNLSLCSAWMTLNSILVSFLIILD